MSETKFTKGEWKISEIGDITWIDDEQGFSIAQVYDCKGVIDNVSLIASAPAMYAVIEKIVKWQDSEGGELKEYMSNSKLSFRKLLAKARGE